MFRVLLPDGELTLSTRIEFLKETVNCDRSSTGLVDALPFEANAIYIHLKSPYTTKFGVLIGNLVSDDIEKIKTGLLKDSYFDFTSLDLVFDAPIDCEKKYFTFLSEKDYTDILG